MVKPRVYYVWDVHGNVAEHALPGPAKLEQLQEWVGGYVERVMRNGILFYIDEDGYTKRLAPNAFWPQFVGPVVQVERGYRT